MKQQQPATGNHEGTKPALKILRRLRRILFPVILVTLGTFFIQAEDDETGMYILLIVIVLIVGLANLVRWIFPKNHRRRDKHGHRDGDGHQRHGDDGK